MSLERLRSYSAFQRAPNPKWFQNCSTDRDGVGQKRWEYVSNGRYKKKHPIFAQNGQVIGHMPKGWDNLAYTYGVVYSDRAQCFFAMHNFFRDNSGKAKVSTVEKTGRFIFGNYGDKYEVTGRLVSEIDHTISPQAYRILTDQDTLLIVSKVGFTTISTTGRYIMADVDFAERRYELDSFAISPDQTIFAASFCTSSGAVSADGSGLYRSTIILYDVRTGAILAAVNAENQDRANWDLYFDRSGKKLELVSGKAVFRYQLNP